MSEESTGKKMERTVVNAATLTDRQLSSALTSQRYNVHSRSRQVVLPPAERTRLMTCGRSGGLARTYTEPQGSGVVLVIKIGDSFLGAYRPGQDLGAAAAFVA